MCCISALSAPEDIGDFFVFFFLPPPGFYRLYEDVANMVQVLEVPLWGGKASLVLLLPFHVEDLARLDKLLTLELLSKWLENANSTSVAVSLPKANITSTVSLQVGTTRAGLLKLKVPSDLQGRSSDLYSHK